MNSLALEISRCELEDRTMRTSQGAASSISERYQLDKKNKGNYVHAARVCDLCEHFTLSGEEFALGHKRLTCY